MVVLEIVTIGQDSHLVLTLASYPPNPLTLHHATNAGCKFEPPQKVDLRLKELGVFLSPLHLNQEHSPTTLGGGEWKLVVSGLLSPHRSPNRVVLSS
ncbi:unnamed protein product [Hydatigera taeniaeformis]|uniref:Uncharacterized protein n=1 Tax=Hydatigena taeniaeformis TaxID=6205 RepID=A0A0R3WNY8_HYDTA|nr:unnamed protein product [Hydatigera taeniaeformis]